jgi:O-antigen ligase
MRIIFGLFFGLVVLGFVAVTSSGVNLVISRVGFGCVLIGVAGIVLNLRRMVSPEVDGRPWLSVFTIIGGSYFLWRALVSESIGLAVPDIALVLIFLGTYLPVSTARKGGRWLIVTALGLVCAANVGVAIAQEISGNSFYVWNANPESLGDTTGLFGHYNPFASFLNGSVFFFLTILLLSKNLPARILSGALALGMVASLVLSGSRGGWVSFIIAGIIWMIILVIYLKQKQSKMVGVAMAAAVMIGVVGISSSFWVIQKVTEKRTEALNEETGRNAEATVSDGGRLVMQQMAFEIFQDSPTIGSGPRAFSHLSLEKWDPDELWMWMGVPDFAHNEYLQTLADYGFVGFAIILLLLLVHVILGATNALAGGSGDDGLSMLQIGAAGGLVAMLSQCFFSFLLHVPSCMILIALLVGLLAVRTQKRQGRSGKAAGILAGSLGIVVSVCLLAMGWVLSHSFLLSLKANKQLANITSEESAFRALDTIEESGLIGRDPKIFEVGGRLAMTYANEAMVARDPELARKFSERARNAFENALKLNPHFAPALAGLPRVHDALGNPDEADLGHEKAMKKIWSREWRLRPHFYAAQSSYMSGVRAHQDNDLKEAITHFRKAAERLARHREILEDYREFPESLQLRGELEGWIAFEEARLLYKKGDDIWRNARPRNPELAYALMLEAQKRYQASEKEIREKDPRWEKQLKQLQVNLGYLEAGRQRAAKLTQEEIEAIISAEAGLDSPPATR